MDSYPRRPVSGTAHDNGEPVHQGGAPAVQGFLSRLMPFPGAGALSPSALLSPLMSATGTSPAEAVTQAAADAGGRYTSSIVAQAASILDEEMARGVTEAHRVADSGSPGLADASHPVLAQVHELVDRLAAAWPGAQSLHRHLPADAAEAGAAESPPTVRPQAAVERGERALISMTLRNREGYRVRVEPQVTDLIGSREGRIDSGRLECSPAACTLEPGEERDLSIALTVPSDARPGEYAGLLVVRGVPGLRALVTIEIA
jgi:hypothetical protein